MNSMESAIKDFRKSKCFELFNTNDDDALPISDKILLERFVHDSLNPEWRPIIIDGTDSGYEVSSVGDIRNIKTGKILSLSMSSKGYKITKIYVNKKKIPCISHRMVALAFIPNPENKPQVNHINGNKTCNWYGNLEWTTCKENIHHAVEHGLTYKGVGEAANHSRYNNEQIELACMLLSVGKLKNTDIAKLTNIDVSTISLLKQGKVWQHISSKYKIRPAVQNAQGSDSASSKYSDAQIHEVCRMLEAKTFSSKTIADRTGVGYDMVHRIKYRKNWTNISDKYKF